MAEDADVILADHVKDLLLEDYRYRAESLWKNEAGGETRINLLVGLVTFVVGALFTLHSDKGGGVKGEPLRYLILASMASLLALGLITFARILRRNEHTNECKQGLDTIRQYFKDHLDPNGLLLDYYPIREPHWRKEKPQTKSLWKQYKREIDPRRFGGLAHTVAGINALIVAAIIGGFVFPFSEVVVRLRDLPYSRVSAVFVAAFAIQLCYLSIRERRANQEARGRRITHAGGCVFRQENGVVEYLLVRSASEPDKWVLPKGHIEEGEGHGEAALREVHEEAGILSRLSGLVMRVEFKARGEDIRAKFYLMEYLATGVAAENRQPEWFPLQIALQRLAFPESQSVLRLADVRRQR